MKPLHDAVMQLMQEYPMPEVAVQKISLAPASKFTPLVYNAARSAGLSDQAARLLTAHIALSTGWGKAADNYRLAGVKADATWRATKPYTVVRGCECVAGYPNNNDPKCSCSPGKGQKYSKIYWRAYNNINESVADIIRILKGSRYEQSWALLQAGDTDYFAQVGRDGWYTADTNVVKRGMLSRLTTINKILGEGSPTINLASIALLGGVGYALLRFWK